MVIKTGNKDLDNYLLKVILHPYKIDNDEVNKLKKLGYTEDEIFDLTVNVVTANSAGNMEKFAYALNERIS